MKKRNGTDGSLLATLPWTLAALGMSIAPHVQYMPVWITATFLACALGRWQIERKRRRLPPAWLRIVLSLLCFIGVFASYDAISGVGPGSALLAVMAALKLLETRKRRDQFVLLFISIFLIMSSLLREQFIWSLPYLLAGIALTMTAWLRMSLGSSIGVRQSFAVGGRLLLYSVPLALAMWVFFPRIAAPFWSVPIDTSTATSGLKDHMSPGDISSLSLSDEVAFRATFDGAVPPPNRRYWRGLVLHRFNGRTWSGSDPTPDFHARDYVEVTGDPVRYQVILEPTRQQWVVALDIPWLWALEDTFMGPQQQLSRVRPVDQRLAYEVTSYPSFRINAERPPARWFWELRDDANPETAELARRMRQDAGNDAGYINAVLQMFREEDFYYTLEPPALGSNPVDRFLFGTRRGFCEHYASAFAVMMRAAGIPSRIVLGYQGGEMNTFGDYMLVRQSDAHAWTEVWLPGQGWRRVDPTAAVAPERIESGMAGARFSDIGASWGLGTSSLWMYRLEMTWDALNAEWNEWILGYGPDKQQQFVAWLGLEDPDWRKMMLAMMVCIALILSAISLAMLRRYRPPPRDPAARLYEQFTRKVGVAPATGETPQAYGRRIAAMGRAQPRESNRVVRAYLAARYGKPSPQSVSVLRSAVAQFSPPARSRARARASESARPQ
jgi:transglutaminase-like putative cysteine protease